MDPKVALDSLYALVVQLGRETDRLTAFDLLDELIATTTNLQRWIERGGFLPNEDSDDAVYNREYIEYKEMIESEM